MKFTMPYNKTVATRSGHTIAFIAGEPTHVPKECWREVQAAGAVPEDADAVQAKQSAAVVVVDDPVERRERFFAAFTQMVEGNKRGDFAASGVPSQKVVEKILGFDIDAKERDELWVEFTQLSAQGEAEALAAKAKADAAAADAAKAAKEAAAADAAKAKADALKAKGKGK